MTFHYKIYFFFFVLVLSTPLLEKVKSEFEDGNLIVDWTNLGNLSTQKANLHKEGDWSAINGTKYTVENILLYDSIVIDIYLHGDPKWIRFEYKGIPFLCFI